MLTISVLTKYDLNSSDGRDIIVVVIPVLERVSVDMSLMTPKLSVPIPITGSTNWFEIDLTSEDEVNMFSIILKS